MVLRTRRLSSFAANRNHSYQQIDQHTLCLMTRWHRKVTTTAFIRSFNDHTRCVCQWQDKSRLPAWWGFAGTQDRQKVQGFLRRVGFCSSDLSSFNELCTQADQNMFSKALNNTDHVLHHLLTPVHNTSHSYSLRPRAHDRELPDRLTHLTDCNSSLKCYFIKFIDIISFYIFTFLY